MATTTKSAPTYPPSESGYWQVKLNRTWEDTGFFYKPGADRIVVNEDVLKRMLADEVIANVVAAD